ncbi:MCE family protein [Rhodococcus sp. HNM0569]|uniref:MCE family protein n=1 Tax=Rhodococcus sp. HNM0569 TaxID=2716340 RepID=UPI00146ECA43|nr:MCE family protein [Rhodococcus sp. HNM0569]NLU84198.1 MCE family protein [Rhodococcus sp. HNM0569]
MKKRNPATIGAFGIIVIILATVAAMSLDSLPIIGAGQVYRAQFTEAAGLKPDNEVRVAGVKVGKVKSVDLDGDRVTVAFQVSDAWLGDQTSASIQIKTILGQKYLSLDPRGSDSLDPSDTIPLERTTAPYDVVEAFSSAADTVDQIDTDQLAQSMQTLSQAFSGTPDDIRASLDGVSRLSQTISSRDQELRRLFDATANTTQILADRNKEFTQLISDGGKLLEELNTRKQAISQLLHGTQRVSEQLSALVQENREQIGPALDQLNQVVGLLNDNLGDIDKAMKLYEPFVRLYTNVVGNGRWFDQVIVNILPPGLPEIPGEREPGRTLGVN